MVDVESPRTLEACLETGILVEELKPVRTYRGTQTELTERRRQWQEKRRLEKMDMVQRQREMIMERPYDSVLSSTPQIDEKVSKKKSSMVDFELKRLDAAKRRQEREIQHMIESEKRMSDRRAKLLQNEKEAKKRLTEHAEMVKEARAKLEAKQRERLQRNHDLAEETMRKARTMAEKERAKDRKREQDELKAKEAHKEFLKLRDQERTEKLREREKRSEDALARIIQAADETFLKLSEREKRLKEKMELKQALKKKELEEQRAKAKARLDQAMDHHRERRKKERDAFETRQKEAAARAEEHRVEALEKAKQRHDAQVAKDHERHLRLVDAVDARKKRRADIVANRERRQQFYQTIAAERDQQNALLKLESDLALQAKVENVNRIRRVDDFNRLKLLHKLQADDRRTATVRNARFQLIEQRKAIAHDAFVRKSQIRSAVEQMRITNNFSALNSCGGLFLSASDGNLGGKPGSAQSGNGGLDKDPSPGDSQSASL